MLTDVTELWRCVWTFQWCSSPSFCLASSRSSTACSGVTPSRSTGLRLSFSQSYSQSSSCSQSRSVLSSR